MRSLTTTGLALVLATTVMSGCRIDVIAPEDAIVRSESGAFDCVGPATCTIEVNDLFFDETLFRRNHVRSCLYWLEATQSRVLRRSKRALPPVYLGF
ncbi:MAG: hypothetical protein AAF098_15405 [Pseudomonadota bacterium]